MMQRSFLLAALSSVILSTSALAAPTVQDTARDQHGGKVMDARGNCVNTNWQTSEGGCVAPETPVVKAAPAPAPKPRIASMTTEERTVYFDFNKANIKPGEEKKLNSLISAVRESQEVESVDIIGHTDPIGSSSYNKKLSEKRADAVKTYLASHGSIKTRNVDVAGLGAQQPATQCDANMKRAERIACLAADRRVTVEFNFKK